MVHVWMHQLSNATPYRTFMLVPKNVLPNDFVWASKQSDYSSASTKTNLAVGKTPQFRCCSTNHLRPGPEHFGNIHISAESMEELHSACQDAAKGIPSRRPVIEMTIPSAVDTTISVSYMHY